MSIVHRLLHLWEYPASARMRYLVYDLLCQLRRNKTSWAIRCPVTRAERTNYRCLYCKMNISSSYYADRHPDCMWAMNIRQKYAFPKVEGAFYCPCCVDHSYKKISEIATHLVTTHSQKDIETMGYSVFMLHRILDFDKTHSTSVCALTHYV